MKNKAHKERKARLRRMQYMSMNNLSLFFRIRHGFSADNGGNSSICNHFAAINRKNTLRNSKMQEKAVQFLH
jgi:hypothetical protein